LNGFNPQIVSPTGTADPLAQIRQRPPGADEGELERIRASGQLSSDVFEVVSKSLA
jgi:aminopeptidase N